MPNAQYSHLANEPLADVLVSLEKERGSAVVEVESPQGRGELSIKNGRLLGAAFKELSGAAAVHAVLDLTVGRYQLHRIVQQSRPSPALGKTLLRASGPPPAEDDVPIGGPSLSELVSAHRKPSAQRGDALRMAPRRALTSSSVPPAAEPGRSSAPTDRAEPLAPKKVQPLVAQPRQALGAAPTKTTKADPVAAGRADAPLAAGMKTVTVSSASAGSEPSEKPRTSKPDPSRTAAAPSLATSSTSLRDASASKGASPSSSDPELHRVKYVSQPVRSLTPDTHPVGTRSEGGEPKVSSPLEAAPVASAPIDTKANFLTTSIQGTAHKFERSRPPKKEEQPSSSWDEEPVPSRRFEKSTLDELEELNEAIQSSRIPRAPGAVSIEPKDSFSPGATLKSPDEEPSPQTEEKGALPRVGRYEILARLKRGGMGSVYLCRLTGSAGFRRLFAMKVLHAELGRGEPMDSFFQEARLLSKLHHPNIVGIVDVGTAQQPFIVLDYVEGGSLFELCESSPKGRDPKNVVSIILDALSGIDAAHRATDERGRPLGIVHCDLTPHNLLVGVDGACRVADFGIATHENSGVDLMRGKPAYVAPERLLGQSGDARSDLFSLGVVLYFALTGVEPFKGDSPEGTLQNVLKKAIPSPSAVGFCPPPSLDWVCMKALARDPADRFQSAEEMMVHLRKVAAREELLTSHAQVADWVSSALRPAVERRRQAAQRESTSDELRGASEAPVPPGVHAPVQDSPAMHGEAQAPPPPPSYTSSERTEYLPSLDREDLERQAERLEGGPLSRIPRSFARLPKKRKMGFYLALAGMVLVLVLVLFLPAVGNLFKLEEDPSTPARVQVNASQGRPTENEKEDAQQPSPQGTDPPDGDEARIELTDLPGAE